MWPRLVVALTGRNSRASPGPVQASEGGTPFLEEVGDLRASIQVKLLRLLQEKKYEPLGEARSRSAEVHIVTATNRNLSRMTEHKAGALTDARRDRSGRFALAEGGTIFLDEIGDVSPAIQIRLLRSFDPGGSQCR